MNVGKAFEEVTYLWNMTILTKVTNYIVKKLNIKNLQQLSIVNTYSAFSLKSEIISLPLAYQHDIWSLSQCIKQERKRLGEKRNYKNNLLYEENN